MKSLKTKFKTTVALALALIMIPATAFAAEEGFETGNSSKEVQVTVNGPQIQYKVTLPLSVSMKDINDLTEDEINAMDAMYPGTYTDLKTNSPFAYVSLIPLSVEGNIGAKRLYINTTFDPKNYINTDTHRTLLDDYKVLNGAQSKFDLYSPDLRIQPSEIVAGYSNSYAIMFYLTSYEDGHVMPAGNYKGNQTIDITLEN